MSEIAQKALFATALLFSSPLAHGTDLTLHLNGSEPITRSTRTYQCDSVSSKMGIPAGIFAVEYLNGAGNSLAVVPVNGKSLIFANVASGSGARYAAGPYIWWDASGRTVTFTSDSLAGKMSSTCHRVH